MHQIYYKGVIEKCEKLTVKNGQTLKKDLMFFFYYSAV